LSGLTNVWMAWAWSLRLLRFLDGRLHLRLGQLQMVLAEVAETGTLRSVLAPRITAVHVQLAALESGRAATVALGSAVPYPPLHPLVDLLQGSLRDGFRDPVPP